MNIVKATALLFFLLCLIYRINSYLETDSPLVFPECNLQKTILETEVSFVVDKQVLKKYSEKEVQDKVEAYISTSNDVLKNSCVPIKRILVNLSYQPIKNEPISSKEYSILYNHILNQLSNDEKRDYITNPAKIVVVLFSSMHEGFTGYSHAYTNNKIIVLSMESTNSTLEHELGHLALADHDLANSTSNKDLKMAHGYSCGRYRSIMNENLKDGELGNFYSSPDISVGRTSCGDRNMANNAEQLRRWSQLLRRKLELSLPYREASQ